MLEVNVITFKILSLVNITFEYSLRKRNLFVHCHSTVSKKQKRRRKTIIPSAKLNIDNILKVQFFSWSDELSICLLFIQNHYFW